MTAYETRDAVARLADIDPELKTWVDEGRQLAFGAGSLEETARLIAQMPPTQQRPDTPTDFAFDIPLRDGRVSKARIHKPPQPSSGPVPLMVYIYGGGFVIGSTDDAAVTAKSIAAATGAVVVTPSYRLAPAHPFPAAPNDVWDAFTWLSAPGNVAAIGADTSAGLVIGGVSAGGNLAAVTAQRYVSEQLDGHPPLTGVLLIVPYLLEPEIVPEQHRPLWFSREQNSEALVFNGRDIEFVRRAYKPDIHSAQLSPLNAAAPHVGLPPVYIQVCGQDPLRDDGLVYERLLRENGVATRLDVYPGVPHGHAFVYPTLRSAVKANIDLVKGAGWLLGREVGEDEAAAAYAGAVTSFTVTEVAA